MTVKYILYWSGCIVYVFLGTDNQLICLFFKNLCCHDNVHPYTFGQSVSAQSGICDDLMYRNSVIFAGGVEVRGG